MFLKNKKNQLFIVTGLVILCICAFFAIKQQKYIPTQNNKQLKITFVIDAGHGGVDGGASGADGTLEKDLTLTIANKTTAIMKLFYCNVVQTRDSDMSIHNPSATTISAKKISDIKNRVKLVNDTENPVLISIHMNALAGNATQFGPMVFYSRHNEESKTMAQAASNHLFKIQRSTRQHKISAVPKSVYFLNHVSCPAILIECGFLSTPNNLRLLKENGYQNDLSAAIALTALSTQV